MARDKGINNRDNEAHHADDYERGNGLIAITIRKTRIKIVLREEIRKCESDNRGHG